MKIKHILTLFILGTMVVMTGALFKVMHWPTTGVLLLSGIVLQIISGAFLTLKLLTNKKFKDFLNS